MFWDYLQKYSGAALKRSTGVDKEVFIELVVIIKLYKEQYRKHPNRGRQAVLSVEN